MFNSSKVPTDTNTLLITFLEDSIPSYNNSTSMIDFHEFLKRRNFFDLFSVHKSVINYTYYK